MCQDWAEYYWSISPPDLDLYSVSGDTDFIQLRELQFGCVSDPVAGLNLHTTWRDLRYPLTGTSLKRKKLIKNVKLKFHKDKKKNKVITLAKFRKRLLFSL